MKKAIQFICVLLVVAMLAIPVSAAGFTPSVEQKGAPAAAEKDVKVTALVDLAKAPAEVQKVVKEAQKSIADAKSVVKAAPAVAEALKETKSTVKAENLVVRDLFYVALDKDLAEGEEKVVTFKAEGIENELARSARLPEIVRCGDCRHYETVEGMFGGESLACGRFYDATVKSDGFCAWGERMES